QVQDSLQIIFGCAADCALSHKPSKPGFTPTVQAFFSQAFSRKGTATSGSSCGLILDISARKCRLTNVSVYQNITFDIYKLLPLAGTPGSVVFPGGAMSTGFVRGSLGWMVLMVGLMQPGFVLAPNFEERLSALEARLSRLERNLELLLQKASSASPLDAQALKELKDAAQPL